MTELKGSLVDFETTPVADRQIIDPYASSGVVFSAVPREWGDEVVGLVKNSVTSACV